jgi:hypothetical protein
MEEKAVVFLMSSLLESKNTRATWPVRAGINRFIIMPIEKVENIFKVPIFFKDS